MLTIMTTQMMTNKCSDTALDPATLKAFGEFVRDATNADVRSDDEGCVAVPPEFVGAIIAGSPAARKSSSATEEATSSAGVTTNCCICGSSSPRIATRTELQLLQPELPSPKT